MYRVPTQMTNCSRLFLEVFKNVEVESVAKWFVQKSRLGLKNTGPVQKCPRSKEPPSPLLKPVYEATVEILSYVRNCLL